jgi:hypothetical protein
MGGPKWSSIPPDALGGMAAYVETGFLFYKVFMLSLHLHHLHAFSHPQYDTAACQIAFFFLIARNSLVPLLWRGHKAALRRRWPAWLFPSIATLLLFGVIINTLSHTLMRPPAARVVFAENNAHADHLFVLVFRLLHLLLPEVCRMFTADHLEILPMMEESQFGERLSTVFLTSLDAAYTVAALPYVFADRHNYFIETAETLWIYILVFLNTLCLQLILLLSVVRVGPDEMAMMRTGVCGGATYSWPWATTAEPSSQQAVTRSPRTSLLVRYRHGKLGRKLDTFIMMLQSAVVLTLLACWYHTTEHWR